jgi:hypothetical protein
LSGYLVCPVHLIYLIGLVQPNKQDKPNKPIKQDRPNRPNEQDGLADFFSILPEKRTGRPPIGGRPVRLAEQWLPIRD